MSCVGVLTNPASGRDIRRLTTSASVFDNAEKGSMVHRLMAGLGAAGVDQVLMMPAPAGVGATLSRRLRGRVDGAMPRLEVLDMPLRGDAHDTVEAVRRMRERDVAVLVVLGGDGTHRVVSGTCADVPLCALSTGTNNAFPEMREATVAGLAAGLVATGQVTDRVLRREKALHVCYGGRREVALVDVAVSTSRFVGARALCRVDDVSEVFFAFASPSAVGLSAIGGLVNPVSRDAPYGLHLRLGPPHDCSMAVMATLAPGLVVPVGVQDAQRLEPGQIVEIGKRGGCLALDGEREVELFGEQPATTQLGQGPLVIDVEAALTVAAEQGCLRVRAGTVPASLREGESV